LGTSHTITNFRIEMAFAPGQASAGEARRAVTRALREWGLGRAEDTMRLLTTELVSNCVRHAMTVMKLVVSYDGSRLKVAVSDRDVRLPTVRSQAGTSPHGWGLRMVELLASDWGTTRIPGGKTVWFELRVSEFSPQRSVTLQRD
jgi:hypothetical protein